MKDIRYALRMLLKDRVLNLVAIITLSLGISATVSHFTIGDKVIFRPINFRGQDRLMALRERTQKGAERYSIAVGDYMDFRRQSTMFESLSASEWIYFYITRDSGLEKIDGYRVTPDFFQAIGVSTAIGRTFSADEGQPGHDRVMILSNGLWRQSFGADPNVLGRQISINGQDLTIIGVMPADYNYPVGAKAWIPLTLNDQAASSRTDWYVEVTGLLKPGATMQRAQSELDKISLQIEQENPQTNRDRRTRILPLADHIRGDFSSTFSALDSAMAALVLLLCCANVANFQLARASARQKEFSIRTALGASRWMIIRQLLIENIILGLLGGAVSIFVSYWAMGLIKNRVPAELASHIPGWYRIEVDGEALLFTLIAAVLTGIIFGLAPALKSSKVNLNQVIKETGAAGGGRNRLLRFLVVAEIAVAIMMLTGASSLTQGFLTLYHKFENMSPGNVLTMEISAKQQSDDKNYQIINSYQSVLQRVSGVAGVETAAVASYLPASGRASSRSISIKGKASDAQQDRLRVCNYQTVSPNFFKAFRIQLLNGRELADQDDENARKVVVISEVLARKYFPNQDPIGQEIKIVSGSSSGAWLSIVGVVSNVNTFWFDQEPRPTFYVPYSQDPRPSMYVVARTSGDPVTGAAAVVNEVRQADQKLAVYDVKPMNDVITEHLAGVRIAVDLIILFSSVALILSATGVYGVVAFFVTQHTHEIGVRMALGALRRDVYAMVIKRGLMLVGIGIVLGLPLSFGLSIAMASFLFGVGAFNPLVIAGLAGLFVAIGVMSSFIPALRASTVDPVNALRYE